MVLFSIENFGRASILSRHARVIPTPQGFWQMAVVLTTFLYILYLWYGRNCEMKINLTSGRELKEMRALQALYKPQMYLNEARLYDTWSTVLCNDCEPNNMKMSDVTIGIVMQYN